MERLDTIGDPYQEAIHELCSLMREEFTNHLFRVKERIYADEFEDRHLKILDQRDSVLNKLACWITNGSDSNTKHIDVAEIVAGQMRGQGVLEEWAASTFMNVTGITQYLIQDIPKAIVNGALETHRN